MVVAVVVLTNHNAFTMVRAGHEVPCDTGDAGRSPRARSLAVRGCSVRCYHGFARFQDYLDQTPPGGTILEGRERDGDVALHEK